MWQFLPSLSTSQYNSRSNHSGHGCCYTNLNHLEHHLLCVSSRYWRRCFRHQFWCLIYRLIKFVVRSFGLDLSLPTECNILDSFCEIWKKLCKHSRAALLVAYAAVRTFLSILIIFINCNWVVTRWQWSFNTYTKHETGLLLNLLREG
jgi:hypothetical protein